MQDRVRPTTIGELPVQTPAQPASDAQARGRFFNSGNAFMLKLSRVPDIAFTDEPASALDPGTPTGLIACDVSDTLGCDYPATSPLVLAYYGRIRAGETLRTQFVSSGNVHYVIQGTGRTHCGDEQVTWGPGDVFITPGGIDQSHHAAADDAVLWIVNNEPMLNHEQVPAPEPGCAPTPLVHYTKDEIDRQIELLYDVGKNEDTAGAAVIFSSDMQEAGRNILPTLTLGMNTLNPGVKQRPHRHNSVAVSLIVSGEQCYSTVDGVNKDWSPWATTITPPTSVHSHFNGGDKRALFLIVQDGGLYYHARANGFEFVDDP